MNTEDMSCAQATVEVSGLQHRLREARHQQRLWRRTTPSRRLRVLRRLRALLATRADELASAVQLPQRRSDVDTLTGEVLPLLDACRFLERRAARLLEPRTHGGRAPLWLRGCAVEILREPHGVVLILGPWNYPLMLTGVQALQALVAGNAVLVKPGRGGGPAAQLLGRLLEEAGLPQGLYVATDESVQTGVALARSKVDKVVLTGSAHTARELLAQLARSLTPATMELSGCDAAFVREDADLALVTDALRFGLVFNGSATCIAPRRVFVHESVVEALEQRLQGALADAPAFALEPRVRAQVSDLLADARARGARVVCGEVSAHCMTPLVLADAAPGMAVTRSDVFAPLLALIPVRDQARALTLSRQCPYALGATVFGSERAARTLAQQVDAGVVVVNDMIVPTADARVPFGGRGESGFGVTRGAEGLLAMTRPKAILVRRGRNRPHFDPVSPATGALARSYLLAAYHPAWGVRLRGLWQLVRTAAGLVRDRRNAT